MKKFEELLIELRACETAKEWAKENTIEEIVKTCHRGDWLLWLAARIKIDKRKLTLVKALCAKTVIHLMKDERSRKAIEVAELYGNGNATDKELRDASDAAYAAAYAADAAAAAADAACADCADAAADAAYAAAYAAADADAAAAYAYADAAYAYADAAADADAAAAADAKEQNQLKTANICRDVIGELIIEQVNELLK